MDDRPLSIRARKKVKAEIERVERERMLMLFQKRMELARAGALASKEGRMREALQNYMSYLEILERSKSIERGKIEPKHFDQTKDIAELLMLSGVFWDLAKIHDRTGSKKNIDKLRYYLDRFVLFSKGMPFERVSSELVRKYLVRDVPRHRKEFKEAHLALGGNRCFVASALIDYNEPDTVPRLRDFRDRVLMESLLGRMFVSVYYAVGPWLARMVKRLPISVQKQIAGSLDRLAKKLTNA